MFEQAFKNIDDILRKEAGCTTELDYTEQTSWLLFLKYLDGLEQDRADEAALERKKYSYILDKPYRWETWAAPKGKDGKLDHNSALTGDDLRDFVNQKLFPYLHGFTQKAGGSNTIEYKIGEIFGEIKNKISSGYNLREIIDHIDELRALWSAPETRKKLLQGLAEKGSGGEQLAEMQKIIDAEKSDLFDVLAHVAYALPPLTREERAARAKVVISTRFNSKQQVFLDFVLSHYVSVGVEELDQDKLTPLLRLKYHNSIADAVVDLGRPDEIGRVFAGFQKYLYQQQAAA
ncbi:type I restriction-modification enzyme R subunit C-terminal domain-containing protein [Candidatus Methylomirabilis sp.]|uniref:type I restriction-modification enzyme R subunit C-terminal domain-containing protein n=1 Tax=Candidatus Methylomirabilis sp. TaxID=2032687 RepID=UPI0030764068